jgi:hypothetical protein
MKVAAIDHEEMLVRPFYGATSVVARGSESNKADGHLFSMADPFSDDPFTDLLPAVHANILIRLITFA